MRIRAIRAILCGGFFILLAFGVSHYLTPDVSELVANAEAALAQNDLAEAHALANRILNK